MIYIYKIYNRNIILSKCRKTHVHNMYTAVCIVHMRIKNLKSIHVYCIVYT